jgi:hypothetical protein
MGLRVEFLPLFRKLEDNTALNLFRVVLPFTGLSLLILPVLAVVVGRLRDKVLKFNIFLGVELNFLARC